MLTTLGCKRQNRVTTTAIPASDLALYLDTIKAPAYWKIEEAACIDPTDTLHSNLPYQYEQALGILQYHFTKTDSLYIPVASRQYIKALIVADFVYAAFSYQFLGPELGLANQSTQQWDTVALEHFYQAGNTNQTAFYCTERTNFYLRLVDTLLGLKGQSVSVQQVHTFPVVQIAGNSYIIDPYDPFVIYDTTTKTIAPYSITQNNRQIHNTIPIRTKRLFGNTRLLLSDSFIKKLKAESKTKCGQCTCELLQNYLAKQSDTIKTYIRPCFQAPEPPLFTTIKHTPTGGPNAYAIEMHGRVDGQLSSCTDIIRYYSGIDCTGN
ncbi:MAG TPA: hypothetical protein PLW44_02680 [Chitinophagales bacterium]|nr:hypothetical protein [Chitinophagales bacterium]